MKIDSKTTSVFFEEQRKRKENPNMIKIETQKIPNSKNFNKYWFYSRNFQKYWYKKSMDTIYITAMTGSATALIKGVTSHSATGIANKK